MHNKKGADPKDRTIMRINFDTRYSFAVVDLTDDLTLTMPETNGRYQSAWIVSEDAYYPGAFTKPGEHKITKEWIGGARYAVIVMRTQANTRYIHTCYDMAVDLNWPTMARTLAPSSITLDTRIFNTESVILNSLPTGSTDSSRINPFT